MSMLKRIVSGALCPVSYTHLDVYKRQGLQSVICGISKFPKESNCASNYISLAILY